MGGAGEEVVGFDGFEAIEILEKGDVTGLSGGITGEVDDSFWDDGKKFCDEVGVAAGTRRVKDDGGVCGDEVEGVFGFGEVGGKGA